MTSNGSVPLGEGTSSTAQGTPLTNDYDRWSRYVTEYADFLADIDSDGEDGQGAFVRGSAGALAPRAEAELAFLERVDPDRAATFRAHLERTRLESGLSSAQAEAQRQELIARRQRQSMAQSLADSYADRREELLLFARGDCVLSEILRWFLQVYHRKYKEVDRPYGWDALAAGLLFEAGSTKLSRKQTSSGDAGPGAKASSSAPAPGAADDVTVVPASADKDTAPGDDGTPGGPAVSEPAPHLSIECVSELRAPLLVVPNDQTQPGGCPQVAYNNATSAAIYLMAKSFPSLYMIYPTTSVLHLAQWVEAELVPYSQRVIDRTCLAREAARETCVFAELPRREGRFYAWSRVAYRAAFPLVAAVGGLLPGRRLYSTALSRDMRARAETLIDLIDASLCPEPEAVGGLVLDADAAMRRLSEHPLFAKHFPEPYVPRTRGAQRSTPDAKRGADDNIIDPNGPSGRASPSTKLTAADIAIACALAPLLCADGTTIGSKLTMRVPSIGHLSAPGERCAFPPSPLSWVSFAGSAATMLEGTPCLPGH
ncbi:hypothetical protein, variant [Fonticula alba]|uniref:Uncharacterized protein n=1 Tax=Fonticula alba TaxID=691883 RepID=A0A058ZEB1_FONAL|nr:hypothetical protein, variant [Fonticula alba]KCV72709.1 hypothetical protein, variant [Fonticula alba]|eukprot:XP_009492410.1 hypothetical protein, variant [Fonticula alba]